MFPLNNLARKGLNISVQLFSIDDGLLPYQYQTISSAN